MKNTLRVTSVALLTTLLVACGGGGSGGCSAVLGLLPGAGCSTPNTPPVANAGVMQNVTTGSLVTLDGSGSRDANNQSLTYLWQMTAVPAGSLAALSSATSAKPTFTADISGNYTVSLVVNDGKANSQTSVVTVFASQNNSAPVAIAGPNQNVSIGSTVTLDGTASSDANRDTLTYKWTLGSIPTNSSATLSSAVSPNPKFTADVAGTYSAILTVNDGKVESTPSVVTITASAGNQAPTAKAGAAQNISLKVGPTVVTLDGTDSFDPNNDPLKYEWVMITRPANSSANFADKTSPKPSFVADVAGTYVASLIVYDGKLYSQAAATTVTVSPYNLPPVADAGAAQNVNIGIVKLDGTKSSDPNGDAIGFAWSIISKPATSTATLSDFRSPTPSFNADVVGTYVASLVVTDSKLLKSENTATVTINVTATNTPPTAIVDKTQTAVLGTVKLDGSKSIDKEGSTLKYTWTLLASPAGSKATSPTSIATPTFTADVAGAYVFSLVVNDGQLDSSPATITVTASAANAAPTAVAGDPQNVITGSIVAMDASKSSDPNVGDTLSYKWAIVSKPAGSNAALYANNELTAPLTASTVNPKFRADASGVYLLSLSVLDAAGLESPVVTTTVTASYANQAPTAQAGAPQSVSTGVLATLDGSASTDPNGDRLTYTWTFLAKPFGSNASFTDATVASPKPQFTPDVPGIYIASLVVSDGKLSSDMKTTIVTASIGNRAPTVSVAPLQNVVVRNNVTLSATVTDPDGDTPSYTWAMVSKPVGSNAALYANNALTAPLTTNTTNPVFYADVSGAYVVSLQVSDGKLSSDIKYITINAGAANMAPVASVAPVISARINNTVTLDATGSSDANGDVLIYRWAMTYKPAGSSVTGLDISTASRPTFRPDAVGVYVFTLVVNDGQLDSTQLTVAVTVAP